MTIEGDIDEVDEDGKTLSNGSSFISSNGWNLSNFIGEREDDLSKRRY